MTGSANWKIEILLFSCQPCPFLDGSVPNFVCRVNALVVKKFKTEISRRGKSCFICVNLGTTHYLWKRVG